ncbi:MAG: 16S rRNA (cytosine(1402)-N(4))-methyltransferase RsmH [Chitinophagales bacterium]|nr:16S rRNA (cytosine(1402)-N(4))-methyltransferase RsmH [Chitinophagales bacterium]
MTSTYHQPVMLHECIDALNIIPNGIYIDVTFGGGGHSKEILKALGKDGKLFAFDTDTDAQANTIIDDRFQLIQSNYRNLKRYLKFYNVNSINGILADFGISSYQIDEPSRGFSIRFDAALDMRMNQSQDLSAHQIINHYQLEDLIRIFKIYGEIPNAKQLANKIIEERNIQLIDTTAQLVNIATSVHKGKLPKYLAQVFQAIRIEVNDEIQAIHEFLEQAAELLTTDGRLVILTYHSLEDRPVKNYFKFGVFEGQPQKDVFGNYNHTLKVINKKPIVATEAELKENPRARSAKLRIAEKI